jgi:hypothetical protein
MSEFVRSIHAAADRLSGQRGGDFLIRFILKPRGAAAGQFTLGWSSPLITLAKTSQMPWGRPWQRRCIGICALTISRV